MKFPFVRIKPMGNVLVESAGDIFFGEPRVVCQLTVNFGDVSGSPFHQFRVSLPVRGKAAKITGHGSPVCQRRRLKLGHVQFINELQIGQKFQSPFFYHAIRFAQELNTSRKIASRKQHASLKPWRLQW
ncbi:MAG: hypothetical protein KGJ60_06590 [Verrucomicrobiota bacterium]|nr:hypothetical protein [Verrucomicrobiota bacterium]